MKTYYNLKLIDEIKQNTYQEILADPLAPVEQKALALQDELELQRLIKIFKEMVEKAAYETLNKKKSMTDHLKQDPYYKLVELIHKQKDGLQKKTPSKKIDKKLMN